jgi:hypothetical protein
VLYRAEGARTKDVVTIKEADGSRDVLFYNKKENDLTTSVVTSMILP